jgi:serine O-acetyltransferase
MKLSAQKLWQQLREEALQRSRREPMLASFYHSSVLNHTSLRSALAYVLAERLEGSMLPSMLLREVIDEATSEDPGIVAAASDDLAAHRMRDPACDSYVTPFLHFKGFHALQAHRVAHHLWLKNRHWIAYLLQNRASSCFDVDIHPGAELGTGIMIDHGSGIVIGETARVGNDVSMLHEITLGGSGTGTGDRHPKIGSNVLISTGAMILGPVAIGEGAKIGAGSLVLEDVAAHTTVAGVPARIVGRKLRRAPAFDMDQHFGD